MKLIQTNRAVQNYTVVMVTVKKYLNCSFKKVDQSLTNFMQRLHLDFVYIKQNYTGHLHMCFSYNLASLIIWQNSANIQTYCAGQKIKILEEKCKTSFLDQITG